MNEYLLQPLIAVLLVTGLGLAAWLIPKFTIKDKETLR